jgi:hypothetical protein
LMVWLTGIYEVKSNREYGIGRADLCLIPKEKQSPAYIFEFKAISHLKSNEILEVKVQQELKSAMQQINVKLYDTELKARGLSVITKAALVFYGKQVWLEHS